MTSQNHLSETIRFHCTACRAELTVPMRLAGVEGPCPSCSHTIQAPIPKAVSDALLELPDVPWMTPPASGLPQDIASRPFPPPARPLGADSFFPPPPVDEKNFKARLTIPLAKDPLDDSWKDRHRDLRRKTRRTLKAGQAAQIFLESRAFRIARVALIILSAGMLVWLFAYMQSHQWRFPGMLPDLADQSPGATSGASRPLGSDANIFTADDDAEIPPVANFTPAPPLPAGTSVNPLAGTPR